MFTAAGDLVYATAANYAAPLAIGSEGQVLGSISGLPAWQDSLMISPVPGADHLASGIKCLLTAGVAMAFGDVGYIKSDSKVGLIDADAIATMSAVVMCIDETIAQDAEGTFLVMGFVRDDTWAFTPGGLVYGSVTGTTGNTLTQTAPSGTDDVVQVLGVATHADRMLFKPSLVQVEHA